MNVSVIKFNTSKGCAGECVGGHEILQRAADLMMTTDLDYKSAFQTAQVQMKMGADLAAANVKDFEAQAVARAEGFKTSGTAIS